MKNSEYDGCAIEDVYGVLRITRDTYTMSFPVAGSKAASEDKRHVRIMIKVYSDLKSYVFTPKYYDDLNRDVTGKFPELEQASLFGTFQDETDGVVIQALKDLISEIRKKWNVSFRFRMNDKKTIARWK